jgi:Flp pilus assembly protein TadG
MNTFFKANREVRDMDGRMARSPGERGQILVIFAIGLVVIIGMVGLVLDGGSTFAQRRVEQNAADLAAVAAANAYLHGSQSGVGNHASWMATGKAAAATSAQRNGYTNGTGGVTVTVPDFEALQSGYRVRVHITAPHANTFARVLGAPSWNVSVTAAAVTGSVDTAVGAAPWTMSIDAFNADGTPKAAYGNSGNPYAFGEGNGDYPNSPGDIAWTDFNGNNNVNTNEVRQIINGSNVVTATFGFGQYLGQHNNGNHTALYSDVNQYLAGHTVPVPIVGPGPCDTGGQAGGCFVGWALFYVVSAHGGSSKDITGYFTGKYTASALSVGECPTPNNPAASGCGIIGGGSLDNLIVQLTE